ncbi:TAM domain methyltransferase [Colletotrichum navitas]|uniref:TAM domain methyltransferase n=1 Tax=Colletotrichum navitas TaxID=681940 RepID=A0AAD8Q153_9PEZI|nr:TAM domain methyltransferase [Colletotrichum navitas]KAK1593813.1 TAM domain methyltransferase [Colletotrichum navitas]
MADHRATPPASALLSEESSQAVAPSPTTAATSAIPPIEADSTEDTNSLLDGYVSDADHTSNTSTSLASSVRDYNWENRRRYHKYREGRYMVPNDELEQDREDMKHALVVNICGGALHSAPLKHPQKILDIGTGTGIWAVEMGDLYPEADITGIDLSPIQPDFVPPNVHFLVDDAEVEWVYPDDSFDYIHMRHMAAFFKDWPKVLSQAYRVLKPGGWIEFQDLCWRMACDDGTMAPDYSPAKMISFIEEGMATWGFELLSAERLPERLKAAGFVSQVHNVKKIPLGAWPKDEELKTIGSYTRAILYDGLQGITMRPMTKGLDWTHSEVEIFLVGVRKDLMKTSSHVYTYYHTALGQKPLE